MTCGIYAIVCDETWRNYVGQTVNLETRSQDHFQKLRRNAHENTDFQNDFNLYGESAFHYEILEFLEDEQLAGQREAYWMGFGENLYNKTNANTKISLTEEELVRFWKWVDIRLKDECWNWTGAKDKDGYGRIKFRKNGRIFMWRANRISYYISNPNDNIHLVVRHTCNNSSYCNPNHLITGTFSQNKLDILDKDDNYHKLDWDIVKDIRQKFLENPNVLPNDLNVWFSSKYNIDISNSHLIKICINENWVNKDYIPPKRTLKYFVTESDKELIKKYILDGLGVMSIYRKLNFEHNIPITLTSMSRTIKNIKQQNGE